MILKKYKFQINIKSTDILLKNKISVQLKKKLNFIKILPNSNNSKISILR